MRRVGNLWDKIASKEALHQAYMKARHGKRRRHACHGFERRLGYHIDALHGRLMDGTYTPHEPNSFYVFEPKKRLIEAPAFRDLVVQHAVYAQVMPIFDRRFIHTSFACRWGKGTHKAADYVQGMMAAASRTAWTLKIDCRKFFYSINHDTLKSQYRRIIKCRNTCELMDKFVTRKEGVGVPIGNLLSQVYGLLYLHDADQFIKRELKIQSYARYVDDMVMVCESKSHAQDTLAAIDAFLEDRLSLAISKYIMQPIQRGMNAFGFRTWSARRFIRKRSLYLAAKRLKQGNMEAFISCLGHARKTASYQHLLTLARKQDAYLQIPQSLRPIRDPYPAN